MINGEKPESILTCLKQSLTERAGVAQVNLAEGYYPEIVYKGDRKKIFESKWASTFAAGNYREEPKPKI